MKMNEGHYRFLWQCTKLNQIAPIYKNVPEFGIEYYKKVLSCSSVIFKHGALFMDDFDNGLVTIKDGLRLTLDNPEEPAHFIHLVGPSNVLSTYCENAHTVASFLRKICKKVSFYKNHAVLNYGTTSGDMNNYLLQLKSIVLKKDDIVIILGSDWFYDVNRHDDTTWKYIVAIDDYCKTRGVQFAFFRRPEIKNLCNPSPRERLIMEHSYEELATDKIKTTYPPLNKKYSMPSYLSHAIALGCCCYDLALDVERPHNYDEIFADKTHLGPSGNNLIAHAIYEKFLRHQIEEKSDAIDIHKRASKLIKRLFIKNNANNKEIYDWISNIKKSSPFHACRGKDKIGCIVMNANPFTYGHLFLIEEALNVVQFLYLFIVEENASEFEISERLAMVKLGTKKFADRVHIAPSGNFIISSFTFPEYFAKARLIDVQTDTSTDLALFATIIAPHLGITYRFVGQEPNCNITNQYNSMMKQLLPDLGVELVEISRKELDFKGHQTPISASTVRRLVREKAYTEIQDFVPPTTYHFIRMKYA